MTSVRNQELLIPVPAGYFLINKISFQFLSSPVPVNDKIISRTSFSYRNGMFYYIIVKAFRVAFLWYLFHRIAAGIRYRAADLLPCLREKRLSGPKLFVSGIGMRAPEGSGYVGMPVAGAALEDTIRQNIARGVDWIKFYETATVCQGAEPIGFYSREEMARIIRTAHEAGKPVTSHCIGGRGLRESVALGIDCIEHAYYATPEELAVMEDAGTWLCVTAGEYFTDKETASPQYLRQMRATRPRVRESMEAIMASGIPLVFGTDGLHGRLWEEARYAVDFGAAPARVLHGLTAGAARLLGAEREIGHIAPGYQADLVLLRRNPLEDITALRDVVQVYQDGRSILAPEESVTAC